MNKSAQLRIAVNAQLDPEKDAGGVLSVVSGLLRALGNLIDGDEEYVIIGQSENSDWLLPLLGSNQTRVNWPKQSNEAYPKKQALLGWVYKQIKPLWKNIKTRLSEDQISGNQRFQISVPVSDGYFESLGCQVIHFPWQSFTLCSIPTIYNPHDLQHLSFPQFFSPSLISWRESFYYYGCRFSDTVVVASNWVKQDVIRHYGIYPTKLQVIPWAPPTIVYAAPSEEGCIDIRNKYNLPETFAFYPAVSWEHKNHLRLVEAQALLRDQFGVNLAIVCSGRKHQPVWGKIEQRVKELNLENLFFHVGIVPGKELRAIYRLSQFVVVPTLFEAMSGPIFEAWQEEKPVACSNVTSLPEQAGDSALIFNPYMVESIADAMLRLTIDDDLRFKLVVNGNARLKLFNWEKVAKSYRAVYRRAAKWPLSEEDTLLLGSE